MKINYWLSLVGAVAMVGCGTSTEADITGRQEEAVSAAVNSACDKFEECREGGADVEYADRDECETEEQTKWNNLWSNAECDGKVNGDRLDDCLNAIKSTACDGFSGFFDEAAARFDECTQDKVCAGE